MIEPVDLTLDAAPLEDASRTSSGRNNLAIGSPHHTAGVAFRPGSRGGPEPSKTPGLPIAAGIRPLSGIQASPPQEEPVSLAKDIEAVIETCKRDTEQAARAYYAALFPGKDPGGFADCRDPALGQTTAYFFIQTSGHRIPAMPA